ncbi:MAG TPA: hypothetical protein VJ904_06690 [Tichowtungia sp.]|nr:hypothetical protein [Tichowtungia sp.]
MTKFFQALFHLLIIAVSIGFAWLYWSGMFPERMKSKPSNTGTEVRLRMTGTRRWRPEFNTMVFLQRVDGDRFAYDLQSLGSREAVGRLIDSMKWVADDTLLFTNYPKNKTVTVSYTNGLWSLEEQLLDAGSNWEWK